MDKQLELPFEENKSKLLRDLEKASEIISNEINNRNARFIVVSMRMKEIIGNKL